MDRHIERLKWQLKLSGNSLTAPRQRVFKELQRNDPMTMQQLVRQCAPDVDRASVYRTVALFESLDIVHRLPSGWKYKLELSTQFSAHHHHLTCLTCGKVIELEEHEAIEKPLQGLAAEHGFQLTKHVIELQGYCSQCLLKP